MSRIRHPGLAAVAALAVAACLAGCGARAAVGNKVAGKTLTIYASLPFDGASSVSGRSVLGGVTMALDSVHSRIGQYRIVLRAVNDSTVKRGSWDPGQTTINARLAIKDKTTIGYIGDYNSGATAVSIPLLNRAGIPQISPSSTAVGLTTGGPAADPGEPQKYYPTLRRTFARVVPNDTVQADALVQLQSEADCERIYVLDDGEVDGRDAAMAFDYAAQRSHLHVVATTQFNPAATDYTSLATAVAQTGADCVLISALTENHAALLTAQVARALPGARLFGTAGLAESTYTDPAYGGIPLSLGPRMVITAPTLAPADYPPAGRRFYAQYAARYGVPQPYAIYGYEAMSLLLDAISRATRDGTTEAMRSQVLKAILSTRNRASVLGIYSIDANGDTSQRSYGAYHVRDGRLVFWKAVDS
ncbi:MAG: branched-chain amino acid ABC transporter substrate-binding protein [Solirubrobacteraceae bacterium]